MFPITENISIMATIKIIANIYYNHNIHNVSAQFVLFIQMYCFVHNKGILFFTKLDCWKYFINYSILHLLKFSYPFLHLLHNVYFLTITSPIN